MFERSWPAIRHAAHTLVITSRKSKSGGERMGVEREQGGRL